jgi:beta-glucuronidase
LGEYLDVLGVNDFVGWYWGRPEGADKMKWTTKWEKPLIISEFGGEGLAGRRGGQDTRWTEEFQANLYSHQIRMLSGIDNRRHVARAIDGLSISATATAGRAGLLQPERAHLQ